MSETEKKKPDDWVPCTITLILQPEGKVSEVKRPKNVKQLLDSLGYLEETALVIRDGNLLTPDIPIISGETITVRSIISHG